MATPARLAPWKIGLAALLAAAAAWAVLGLVRDGRTPAAPPTTGAAGSAVSAAGAVQSTVGVAAGQAPRAGTIDVAPRPGAPSGVGAVTSGSPADAFAAEAREPAWAEVTERLLGERVAGLALGGTTQVTCKTSACEVALSGLAADTLVAALAALESPRGLGGVARAMLVGAAPSDGGPWRLHLRVR